MSELGLSFPYCEAFYHVIHRLLGPERAGPVSRLPTATTTYYSLSDYAHKQGANTVALFSFVLNSISTTINEF